MAFLLLFFLAAQRFTHAQAPAVWNGTANTAWFINPAPGAVFEISTAEQLAGLAHLVNANTTFAGMTVRLMNNIFLNDTTGWRNWGTAPPATLRQWTPTGTIIFGTPNIERPFAGTFDGQNFRVLGIYINQPLLMFQGLFGFVNNGTIQNVGVEASFIRGQFSVGALSGEMRESTITNSFNRGNINGNSDIGGLIGVGISNTISNSRNFGAISGNNLVGGLVGTGFSNTISNSFNTGNIIIIGGGSSFGGLMGDKFSGSITNSYNTGSVTGEREVGGLVGVAGSNNATIINSFNTGVVIGTNRVGGLAGISWGTVANSYNTGSVTGTTEVGRLVGNNLGTVTNSFFLEGTATQGVGFGTAGGESKTQAQFNSGEVAHLLQGVQTPAIWGHTVLGGTELPRLIHFAPTALQVRRVTYASTNPVHSSIRFFLNNDVIVFPALVRSGVHLAWRDQQNNEVTATSVVTADLTLTAQWTNNWVGTNSRAWELGGNWAGNILFASDHVNIPNVANQPILSTTATVQNLTIAAGASLEIASTGQLAVSGTLTNHAGNAGLMLRSGASLVHSTAGIAATMERNFPGARAWRLVSSPVVNQAISGPWLPATPNHGYDFFAWSEATSIWLNQRVAGNNINYFVPGRGYLVSFEGTNLTQTFAGILNHGNVTTPITRLNTGAHRGANLIGNPYPSAIDWNSAVRTAFADNFAYIYNPLLGGGGGYEFVNGANAGALIAPNQGFFVLASTAGTFTFTNAMRTSGTVAFKSEPVVENMVLRLSQGNLYNQTTLALVNDSRWERDRNDALKFFSFNSAMPQLFSQSADQVQLAVNSVPLVNQSSEFTLGLRAPATGQYTLSLQTSNGVFAQGDVFVRDLLTGAVHNLRQNPQFAFHATQGDHAARFKVSFTQPTTVGNLPQGTTAIYVYNNILHLNFASDESNRLLQVFDISGRVVKSQRLQDGASQSIPLALEMGTYIVRITDSKGVATQRVMVR